MALIAIYISNNLGCIRNEGLDVVWKTSQKYDMI